MIAEFMLIAIAGVAIALLGIWNINRATTPDRAYRGMFQFVIGALLAVIFGIAAAVSVAHADGESRHWCKYAPGYHATDWWKRCRGATVLPRSK